MKNIYTHLLYVGGLICVAPIFVQGYAKGKLTEAYAAGSTMNIQLGGLAVLDYLVSMLGAGIIGFVIYNVWRDSSLSKAEASNGETNISTNSVVN